MKITFVPEDKDIFKNKIIETKCAIIFIEYMDGIIREKYWRIKNFNNTSGLLHNIESQDWYTKDKFNIKQVVLIAGDAQTRESLNLFKGSVKKGPEQKPITHPWQGRDENRELVYYNDNVDINKRVEGLCEKLEIEYIEYLTHFASYIFRDIIDGEFYLPKVVLCKECPSEIWTNSDSFITRKINELIKKGDLVNEQQIAQILRHQSRIAGEFIHNPRPLIKIYFNQFDSADWNEYFAEISQTLAHEYMHYLEYEYCRRSGSKSFTEANVSEALADFFSVIYSLSRGTDKFVITDKDRIEVAEKRYNEWVKWDGSGWPYAYALYFMKKRIKGFSPIFREYYDKGCIEKLRTVFVATLNPKDAYGKLVNL